MTISYGLSFKIPVLEKSRATEYGELLRYFMKELNAEIDAKPFYMKGDKKVKLTLWTEARLSGKICHLKVGNDLSAVYYLKSICDDAKRRNGSFGKCFNGSLKVK